MRPTERPRAGRLLSLGGNNKSPRQLYYVLRVDRLSTSYRRSKLSLRDFVELNSAFLDSCTIAALFRLRLSGETRFKEAR